VPNVPPLLQPVAHAFIMAREDAAMAASGLAIDELWTRPGGIAPVGFHLAHLAGSTDRLLTYARGEALSASQREVLLAEQTLADIRPPLGALVATLDEVVRRALEQLAATPESILTQPRAVGRLQLPSTVLGLLFHAAEHAARHTGQIVTTSKLVRALRGPSAPAATDV
jgi:uncharacterized damage-inducible protein DinB